MATILATIKSRRGAKNEFDETRMKAGELAVTTDGSDEAYISTKDGTAKEFLKRSLSSVLSVNGKSPDLSGAVSLSKSDIGLDVELNNKITKVSPAVAGNLPVLTATGELDDSGKKPTPAGLGALPGVESVTVGSYTRTTDGVTEWINPPMILGVEYRTTERHNGKVVYKKAVDFGALPNASTKNVAFSSTSVHVISLNLAISDGSVISAGVGYDHMYSTTKSILVGNTTTNIRVITQYDMTSLTATAIVKYTK